MPGVRSVGVNAVLCPGESPTCPAVRDRILLYRDDTHLTNVAAVVLAPRLERLLTESGALPVTAPGGPGGRPAPHGDGAQEPFDGAEPVALHQAGGGGELENVEEQRPAQRGRRPRPAVQGGPCNR